MTVTRRQFAAIDLVGPAEIAARLEVKPNTIAMWRVRFPDFPAPELTLSRVPLWRFETVRNWALANGRSVEVRRGEITSEDLRVATASLSMIRAQLLREVRAAADAVADILAEQLAPPPRRDLQRVAGRYVSNDGRSNGRGEWDWLFDLSDSERTRLARHFSPGGMAPDQWLEVMSWRVGTNLEDAMAEWVAATRLVDAVRSLSAGHVPAYDLDVVTSYNVRAVFSSDGATEIARAWKVEREHYEDTPAADEPLGELVEMF